MKFIALILSFYLFIGQVSAQKLIWSKSSSGKIMQSDLDGNNKDTLLAQSLVQYHILDTIHSKIYWSDYGQNKIFYSNLDGTDVTTFISNLNRPAGICIHDNSFYLVDGDKIKKYDLDGVFQQAIHSGLDKPSDIVIYKTKMYWGDTVDKTIKSSLLDGTQVATILTETPLVGDLEINPVTNKIFWAQSTSSSSDRGIYKADLDGNNLERLMDYVVNGFTLDAISNKIYWSEEILNNVHVASIDDLANSTMVFNDYLLKPTAISIHKSTGKIYVSNNEAGVIIFQGNISTGSHSPLLFTSVYNPAEFVIDTLNQKIYWINKKGWQGDDKAAAIMTANLDGTNIEKILQWPDVRKPSSLAIDVAANKLFWTDYKKKNISSAQLDGTNITELYTGLDYLKGIYLHNNQIYWITNHAIHRSDYNGLNSTELISGLGNPKKMSISATTNKIFWTDLEAGSISTANLDGMNVAVITTSIPDAYTLFLDEYHQQIYVGARTFNNSKFFRLGYDGTNISKISVEKAGFVEHIAVLNPELIVGVFNNFTAPNLMTISPNPFSNDFEISADKGAIQFISIYNTYGIEVFRESLALRNSHSISALNNMPSGIYWVKVQNTNNQFTIKKIIKE